MAEDAKKNETGEKAPASAVTTQDVDVEEKTTKTIERPVDKMQRSGGTGLPYQTKG